MPSSALLSLLLSCTSPTVPTHHPAGDGGAADGGGADTGFTSDGGGSGADTAGDGGGDTAGDGGGDTAGDGGAAGGGGDTGPEIVPGIDPTPPGLCHVTVDCGGVAIPDEPKLGCSMTVADSEGRTVYDDHAGLELRGRSSLGAPKHQYAVELWDADGNAQSANLLDMGADADWVLNGAWYDRDLLRNTLGYDLFRAAGDVGTLSTPRYAPESRYCDLQLDGTWIGIFMLVEKIKQDDDRIDLAPDDGSGSAFVLKLDDTGTIHSNALGYGGWKVVSPADPTPTQLAGISATLDDWEAVATRQPALLGEVVDVDDFIDLILLEELVKNNDAFFLSLHLWKDVDGKLELSPWDLDLSLGQPSYNDNENPESWLLYRPSLVASLSSVPGFDARLAARWAELRGGPWATDEILARIDTYQATMGADAIAHNFEVWPIGDVDFGGYLYPVSSYAEEDARVRAFLEARLTWMDTNVDRWSEGS